MYVAALIESMVYWTWHAHHQHACPTTTHCLHVVVLTPVAGPSGLAALTLPNSPAELEFKKHGLRSY